MNNHKTRLDERSTKQIFYADQTNFFKINYNGATTSSDGTQATFTSSGRVNFLVDFEQFHKYSQIKSIKIRGGKPPLLEINSSFRGFRSMPEDVRIRGRLRVP